MALLLRTEIEKLNGELSTQPTTRMLTFLANVPFDCHVHNGQPNNSSQQMMEQKRRGWGSSAVRQQIIR